MDVKRALLEDEKDTGGIAVSENTNKVLVSAGTSHGFTMIEIMVVVVILAITAMLAVPMLSSASSVQLRSAANMIAADLEYAKSMAISRQKNYTVVFNELSESYQIEDANGIIDHPVKKGFTYVVNFSTDSRIDKVEIADADFSSASQVEFDWLGSPDVGGSVTLQAGGSSMTINVTPVTGYISITD